MPPSFRCHSHASRYFELYHPSGCIEIAHTSRYSHHTGKSELCSLATRNLAPGAVITELKGSMANLTDEEDKELKRTDLRNSDIRRDFSVIHSKQMKKNHLFFSLQVCAYFSKSNISPNGIPHSAKTSSGQRHVYFKGFADNLLYSCRW